MFICNLKQGRYNIPKKPMSDLLIHHAINTPMESNTHTLFTKEYLSRLLKMQAYM